eukprot:m.211565 g.211565  ORF g.211565 m.211565 type:complete len:265 (+) comp18544_c0_seq1:61-855(+)
MGLLDNLCGWQLIARITGVVSSIVVLICGAFAFITGCFSVGIYMIVLSFIIGLLEAPLLFQCWDFMKTAGEKMAVVSAIQRAAIYAVSTIGIFFCLGLTTLFAALLVLATAFFYGLHWLGPRGSAAPPRPMTVPKSNQRTEDVEMLIQSTPHEEADEAAASQAAAPRQYPWERFLNGVGEAGAKMVGQAVVQSLVGEMSGGGGAGASAAARPANLSASTPAPTTSSSAAKKPANAPTPMTGSVPAATAAKSAFNDDDFTANPFA